MPNTCAIRNCLAKGPDIIFHRFPKDEKLKQRWMELCRRKKTIPANARICSLHFKDSDYKRNLMHELLGTPVPKNQLQLKNGALPTLRMPESESTRRYAVILKSSSEIVKSVKWVSKKKPKLIKCRNPKEVMISDSTPCPSPYERGDSCEKSYKCTVCDTSFFESGDLKKHKRTHMDKKPHNCTYCENSFSRSGHLKRHLRTHTGDKPYNCTLCESSFYDSDTLKKHMRTHTGEKPYRCTLCESSFSQLSSLKTHMRIHTGDKPYKCSLCETSFSQCGSLNRHFRTHTGEKPYKCTSCKSSFSQSSDLKKHMIRTHTSDKTYRITFCKSSFSDSDNLKSHIRTHTGDKPYKCTICESSFFKSTHLKIHMRTHKGDKPYECTICKSSFSESDDLKNHMGSHTSEEPHECIPYETKVFRVRHFKVLVRRTRTTLNERSGTSDYHSNKESEGCISKIPCGSSQALLRHAEPKSIMSHVPGEAPISVVNMNESSNELALSQIKEEVKVEECDIDEVTN